MLTLTHIQLSRPTQLKIRIPTALEVTSRPGLDFVNTEDESELAVPYLILETPTTNRPTDNSASSFAHMDDSMDGQRDTLEATVAWQQEQLCYATNQPQQLLESPPFAQTPRRCAGLEHALVKSTSFIYQTPPQSSRRPSICSATIMSPFSCSSLGPFTPQHRTAPIPFSPLSPAIRSEASVDAEDSASFDTFGYLSGKDSIWSKR